MPVLQICVFLMILPGVLVWPVVAGGPDLGANDTAIHIVTHQVVEMFGGFPFYEGRSFGVPRSDHLAWS